MKERLKKTAQIVLIISVLSIGVIQVYAQAPDPYQNRGSNNIAYDLISKWYMGGNLGISLLSDNTATSSNQNTSVDANSMDFGAFGGYTFNAYFSLEANVQRLAHINDNSHSAFSHSYRADVYNLSLDGLVSYPVISGYQYIASLYGKAGYGMNFTHYRYNVNDSADKQSGNLNRGAYHFGLGVNVDFRSNISARVGYSIYQAFYPLPGMGNWHYANVLTLGMYYNFA